MIHKRKYIIAIIIALTLIIPLAAYTAPAKTTDNIDTIQSLMEIIKTDYYKNVEEEELIRGAIDGMFKTLDPHSNYLSPDEFKELMEFTGGEFGGIGVSIERRDDRITVVSPIEGTPAYEAGLNTGDKIVSVDDTDIKDYALDKAVTLIKGKAGTKVKLGVIKAGTQETIYIELTRAIIKIESVKTETPYGKKSTDEIKNKNIGYIRLTEFSEHTNEDFRKIIEQYKKENKKGLIIDLRSNPGGLLDSVVKICQQIIPEGPIVHIDAKTEKNNETYNSKLKEAPFKLAVLVNGGSASASEILAGAVKDSKAGIIVGTKTYGKGTVQNISYLSNGGGIKLTIAEYMTRNKIHIDGKGIEPDFVVEPMKPQEGLATVVPEGYMHNGTVNINVYGIQQRLINLGFDIRLDGVMGRETLNAANKLFRQNGFQSVQTINQKNQQRILDLYDKTINEKVKDIQLETAVKELQKLF